jgi:REP element-mobilizing transposase RayT
MLRKAQLVEKIVRDQARNQHIQVTDYVNVGNHLHLVIKIYAKGSETSACFSRFIRASTGLIARKLLGAERGAMKLNGEEKFWPTRPYTRVLSNAKQDYVNLHNYLTLNMLEAIGFDRSAWELKQALAQAGPPSFSVG